MSEILAQTLLETHEACDLLKVEIWNAYFSKNLAHLRFLKMAIEALAEAKGPIPFRKDPKWMTIQEYDPENPVTITTGQPVPDYLQP